MFKLFFQTIDFDSGTDAISALPLAGIAHPSDVLDMPVDPNEPTYCLCHQVSYGEMIGCDNTDVSRFVLQLTVQRLTDFDAVSY